MASVSFNCKRARCDETVVWDPTGDIGDQDFDEGDEAKSERNATGARVVALECARGHTELYEVG